MDINFVREVVDIIKFHVNSHNMKYELFTDLISLFEDNDYEFDIDDLDIFDDTAFYEAFNDLHPELFEEDVEDNNEEEEY